MSVYKGIEERQCFQRILEEERRCLKRFASLFDLRKRKKGIISLILVALLIYNGIMYRVQQTRYRR